MAGNFPSSVNWLFLGVENVPDTHSLEGFLQGILSVRRVDSYKLSFLTLKLLVGNR